MGHSRTPTQNTAGDGFPADPIGGTGALQAVTLGHAFGGPFERSYRV